MEKFNITYHFQINNGVCEIWEHELAHKRELLAIYPTENIIAIAKTGTRDDRNITSIFTSCGKVWTISRQSLKEFTDRSHGLEDVHFTAKVKASAIDRIRYRRNEYIEIGIHGHKLLFPVATRWVKSFINEDSYINTPA